MNKGSNKKRKYSIYKALYLSFFSKDLYVDVLRNWTGMGLSYILFLSCVFSIIAGGYSIYKLSQFDNDRYADNLTYYLFEDPNLTFEENFNRLTNIISQIPNIEIKDNIVTTQEDKPYYIQDPITEKKIAIIDTIGDHASYEDSDVNILITKHHIDFKIKEIINGVISVDKVSQVNTDNLNNYLNILAQIPNLKIINSQIQMDEESPYYIYGKDNKEIVVIDVVSNNDYIDNEDIILFINKDKIFFKNFIGDQIEEVSVSDINSDSIFDFISSFFSVGKSTGYLLIIFVFIPVFLVRSFIFLSIMVFIIAFVALALNRIYKLSNFTYDDALRMSAVSSTAAAVFVMLFQELFAGHSLIYFLLLLGYLNFAIKSNIEKKEE